MVIERPDRWGFDVPMSDKRRSIIGWVETDKWLNKGEELLIKGNRPDPYELKCKVIDFSDGIATIRARQKDFIIKE